MKYWRQALQLVMVVIVAFGIGCAPPASTPEASQPATDESPAAESVSGAAPKMDNFDQPDASLFTVNEPHKIEGGMLHLQAAQEDTVLLSSAESSAMKEYTVTAEVMPPSVGESAGLAFAVRGESSQILFYVYRAAGADPFGKLCNVGVAGRIGGRNMRARHSASALDIRVREIAFQKDAPIKLSIRHVGQNVTLSIDGENVGRFTERSLKPGKVGVYGKSQHGDGSPAIVKFDSFEVE